MEPSDPTRALLRAYRAAIEPPPGALERQHARVHARLAAAPPPPRRRLWVSIAAAAALLALLIGGLGLYIDARIQRAVDASLAQRSADGNATGVAQDHPPAPRREPARAPEPAVTPAPEPVAAPPELVAAPPEPAVPPPPAPLEPVVTPAPPAAPAVAPARRRPPSRPSVVDADSLRLEGALLSQARDALARGDWPRVLTLVDTHRREHPQGALLEERLVLEAAAACEAGQAARGQTALRALQQRFPGSLALSRVASACAGDSDE